MVVARSSLSVLEIAGAPSEFSLWIGEAPLLQLVHVRPRANGGA